MATFLLWFSPRALFLMNGGEKCCQDEHKMPAGVAPPPPTRSPLCPPTHPHPGSVFRYTPLLYPTSCAVGCFNIFQNLTSQLVPDCLCSLFMTAARRRIQVRSGDGVHDQARPQERTARLGLGFLRQIYPAEVSLIEAALEGERQ